MMIVIIVEMLNIYLLCKTDCSGNRVSVVRVNHETHLEIDFLECDKFILDSKHHFDKKPWARELLLQQPLVSSLPQL